MSEEKKAFWSSLPGVLSGIAAIIGASATLYIAVIKSDAGKAPSEPPREAFVSADPSSVHRLPAGGMTEADTDPDAPSAQRATTELGQVASVTASEPVAPPTTLTERLIGIWYSESQGPTQTGSFFVRGTTEYFRNGSASTVMEVTISERMPTGNELAITYDAVVSSEWQLHNRELIERLVDLKSVPKYLSVDGLRSPVSELDFTMQQNLPKLEDLLPVGHTASSEIMDMQRASMQVRSKDAFGNLSQTTATRRNQHFVATP